MKNIIICSDGTWQSPESDTGTHVLRIARGIAPHDSSGHQQVVYYDWGLGSDGNTIGAGLTGQGIDKNILDCYRFIVHNYDDGDRLYLFGFSRGAYTVRSLAGLIHNSGILRREQAQRIGDAYRLYRRRSTRSAPARQQAAAFRHQYCVADISRIHFVGVLDTVGSLGIPAPFLGTLGTDRYLFHDTQPSAIINHARHAVSIDENRQDFEPALWTTAPGIDLQQVWFAGVHSDIGGSYPDHSLGDHAAQWLTREAAAYGLLLAPHFTAHLAPNHAGPQHNEYRGFYRAMRRRWVREVEPVVHASVKQRWDDRTAAYRSPALERMLDQLNGDWSRIQLVE